MSIENRRQCENTRVKIAELEELYNKKRQETAPDAQLQELTLRSLKKRINQFKEEVARFESHTGSTARSG